MEQIYSREHLDPVEDDYLLKDPVGEQKFGFKLEDALERARENKGKLFAGLTFYVTPKVSIDTKLLRNVIQAGGGQVSHSTTPLAHK